MVDGLDAMITGLEAPIHRIEAAVHVVAKVTHLGPQFARHLFQILAQIPNFLTKIRIRSAEIGHMGGLLLHPAFE